jgi:pyruvate, water dikinase
MKLLDLFSTQKSCRLLVNLEGEIVERYGYFKEFLEHNYTALNILAELEQIYYTGAPFNMGEVEKRCEELLASTRKLAESLDGIGGGAYGDLVKVCDRLAREIALLYYPAPFCLTGPLVAPLESLGPESYSDAGGKATNLALLASGLDLPIPPGFVVTATAFGRFLEEARLIRTIEIILASLSPEDLDEVEARSADIRRMIMDATLPPALAEEILKAYAALEDRTWTDVRIAMRSSAVGEDTEASFAGQYLTRLNITRADILEAYKEVVASKYAPRAILYRLRYGLDDRDTPMCVAGIAMIQSRASGVLYTVDPAQPHAPTLKISSIWGQGEHLVSGEASPDEFFVDKGDLNIVERVIGKKQEQLVTLDGGGLRLEKVPEPDQDRPSIDDSLVIALAEAGLKLEEYFQGPQDVEWALDPGGRLYFLQSRPLGLVQNKVKRPVAAQEFPDHPILLSAGKAASPGIAAGVVCLAGRGKAGELPEDPILVTKTASPDYAVLMGRIKGLITDVGSFTSHLASVAREFGVPAILDAGNATTVLEDGQPITLVADTSTVYEGLVGELADLTRPLKKHIINSPMHRRLKTVLDKLSPLNLTDPEAPEFAPSGCQTLHDVIRFAHERSMQEMFGLGEAGKGEAISARLITNLPLTLHLIDLGGGLESGLTTCHEVTPDHLESRPMRALWRGLSHPGIRWSGGIAVSARDLVTLMARGVQQGEGDLPGGDSFAIISRDYANVSAKFSYHYATLDAFMGDKPEDNYFSLQFSGGAGSQAGRSLRLSFLGKVLDRLGCKLKVTGDLLDASVTGLDPDSMEATLDQVGRLLASSRLLDMAITNKEDVDRMVEAFFAGDYDFAQFSQEKSLPDFYTPVGDWRLVEEDGHALILADGSSYGSAVSSGLASLMGKILGTKYQALLDNIGAYFYFPLAIAKDSSVTDAVIKVRTRSVAGKIDQTGGLAFAIRDVGNYFVLRINALEDNFTLFEYVNNERVQRNDVTHLINTDQWYTITVEVHNSSLKGYLDGELLIEYDADHSLQGFVGLWTKADSVTYFDELSVEAGGRKQLV